MKTQNKKKTKINSMYIMFYNGKKIEITLEDLIAVQILKKYLVICTNITNKYKWINFKRGIYDDDPDVIDDFKILEAWLEGGD